MYPCVSEKASIAPWKKRFRSCFNIVRDRLIMEKIGVEHYPHLTSILVFHLTSHIGELLSEDNRSAKIHFEELTKRVLGQLPKITSLLKVLEAHGWDGSHYKVNKETGTVDFNSLRRGVRRLYYSHLWKNYGDTSLAICDSVCVIEGDDRLAGAFVPSILYSLLNLTQSNIDGCKLEPTSIRFSGACMLADISGFTKLSSKFCARGLAGLDDLHNAANGFLGRYVQIVHAHGGDVIAFAGDALVCIFIDKKLHCVGSGDPQAESLMMQDCCVRAVNCAFALTSVFTEELSSHVAISCGDMTFGSLGGYKNDWTYLLNGAVIPQLSTCIDEAGSKQVVVTADVHSFLKQVATNDAVCEVTETGNYLVKSIDSSRTPFTLGNRFRTLASSMKVIEAARHFVPRPPLLAIKYGTLDTISELRRVTTVFIKLDSYDAVKHADPLTLQPYFLMAQEALFKTGGFMRQFLVDDKGCVLIAMWGVPSFTYSNDAARAVSFALSVRAGTLLLGHRCSIGITTGNVYCGNIGSVVRRDFVGIGATVNLAARLMGKSKGYIYVSDNTYAYLPKEFREPLEKTDGMKLKGYDVPMYAYICYGNESLDASNQGTVPSTFVQASIAKIVQNQINKVSAKIQKVVSVECDSLESLKLDYVDEPKLDDAENRNVWCSVIEGQSGGGKSAIANLFISFSSKSRLLNFTVKLKTDDKLVSHAVFRKLFVMLIGPSLFKDEVQQRAVCEMIAEKCHWINDAEGCSKSIALAKALGLPWANASISSSLIIRAELQSSNYESIVLFNCMYLLLAQNPCSILIEHAHFCDELSWEDLRGVMDLPISLALLITARIGSRVTRSELTTPRTDIVHEESRFGVKRRRSKLYHVVRAIQLSQSFVADMKTPKIQVANVFSTKSLGVTDERNQKTSSKLAYDRAHYTEAYHGLISHEGTTKLELQPLTFEEIRMLITEDLHVHEEDFPDDVVGLIHDVSYGNAYWCKEIAKFVLEKGIEEFRKNPRSVLSTVIILKVENLTTEQQVVLKNSAAVGEDFSVEMLHLTLQRRVQDTMVDSLMYLADHNFITLISSTPLTYCFPNPIIRSIVYDLIPPRERSKLHMSIAEQVEGLHEHNLEPFYDLLSNHFGLAEEGRDKGLIYACKAAKKFANEKLFNSSLEYLEYSVDLVDNKDGTIKLLSLIDQIVNSVKETMSNSEDEEETEKYIQSVEKLADLLKGKLSI